MSSESEPQLRILIVCQKDLANASEKQAFWFGQELARRGHRVLLSMHGDPATAEREGAVGIERLDTHFHAFHGRFLRRTDLAKARVFGPTLIHAFNPRIPVAAAAKAYARATGAPVFMHWEDDEFGIAERVHTRSLVRRVGTYARGPASLIYPPLGPMATPRTIRWAKEAAGHDALTPALADWVRARVGSACSVVLPISPHVHDPLPEPSNVLNDLRGRPVLMVTGTVHGGSVGDIAVALAATASVRQSGHDAVFVHAGRVFPAFDTDALIRDADLTPSAARFLGYLPFSAVPALLREADVLLQPGEPSRFNLLRLPSKIQAYLAAAVPTITFAAGFGELLQDGEEVLKLRTHEPQELADAILRVLEEPDLRARLSGGGRAVAQRLFDPVSNGDALATHFLQGLGMREGDPTREV